MQECKEGEWAGGAGSGVTNCPLKYRIFPNKATERPVQLIQGTLCPVFWGRPLSSTPRGRKKIRDLATLPGSNIPPLQRTVRRSSQTFSYKVALLRDYIPEWLNSIWVVVYVKPDVIKKQKQKGVI